MVKNIEIIAIILESKMKELGNISSVNLEEESFTLTLNVTDFDFIFSCSLHHLDMPWQITSKVYRNKIEIESLEKFIEPNYSYENPIYDITPLFLKNINYNMFLLADRIKSDIKKYLHDVGGSVSEMQILV